MCIRDSNEDTCQSTSLLLHLTFLHCQWHASHHFSCPMYMFAAIHIQQIPKITENKIIIHISIKSSNKFKTCKECFYPLICLFISVRQWILYTIISCLSTMNLLLEWQWVYFMSTFWYSEYQLLTCVWNNPFQTQ